MCVGIVIAQVGTCINMPCSIIYNSLWGLSVKGTYGYDGYFGKLADNGGNYARLWLTDVVFDGLAVQVGVAQMSLPDTWLVLM